MRSSGSTPSPSSRPSIRLLLEVVGDDHPKACTGRRLLHRGMAHAWSRSGPRGPAPILLDPYAKGPVSASDLAAAEAGGLLVVDCSWNKLSERGRFSDPTGAGARRTFRRRLPLLIAGNPQHYGRLAELNTVEAFGAALWVLGRPAEAETLLGGFHGGPAFLQLNSARLARYAGAQSSVEIEAAEISLFGSEGLGAVPVPPAVPAGRTQPPPSPVMVRGTDGPPPRRGGAGRRGPTRSGGRDGNSRRPRRRTLRTGEWCARSGPSRGTSAAP